MKLVKAMTKNELDEMFPTPKIEVDPIKKAQIFTKLLTDNRFHQTGSRYWNRIDPVKVDIPETTDWDFVSEYSEEVISNLYKIGFHRKSLLQGDYGDGHTVTVLYLGEEGNQEIQIIFKKNVDLYLDVFKSVGIDFYVNFLWKKNTAKEKIVETLQFLYKLRAEPPKSIDVDFDWWHNS